MKSINIDLSGKRVLVTGSTGLIGGRLIEKLALEYNSNVRALVRNFTRASRIKQLPIEMVKGDVTDFNSVKKAADGCDIVFHCAYGNRGDIKTRRSINVEGTKNVMKAALDAGVKHVVHVSTFMVYQPIEEGELNETTPYRQSGNNYSTSKLEAERVALQYAKEDGLPVVVIQPSMVYGPFSQIWTVDILQQLKTQRIILINNGDGLCNTVYIDDVINAMLLAAVKKEAVGEVFIISAEQPVTWREFYHGYERMLGISATVEMSRSEAEAYYAKRQRKIDFIFRQISKVLRKPSLIRPLDPSKIQFYSTKTRVGIDKARRILGYQPAYDFESGMKLTEEWAKGANLLDR